MDLDGSLFFDVMISYVVKSNAVHLFFGRIYGGAGARNLLSVFTHLKQLLVKCAAIQPKCNRVQKTFRLKDSIPKDLLSKLQIYLSPFIRSI